MTLYRHWMTFFYFFMSFLISKCWWLILEMIRQKYLLRKIPCMGENHRKKDWYLLIC